MEPKKRYPRIERDEPVMAVEDENAHLWAISYSDFLMALLSFFILFFSMDNNKQSRLVLDIAGAFTKLNQIQKNGQGHNKTSERLPAQFADIFKQMNVKASAENDFVIINFPNDFFENGKYAIQGQNEKTMVEVLEKLKPFNSKIDIFFEGHTDDKPLHAQIQSIVLDNFLLSSLRASAALFKAREMGFDEKNLFIQASSSNLRNSRTLSLRIKPKGDVL